MKIVKFETTALGWVGLAIAVLAPILLGAAEAMVAQSNAAAFSIYEVDMHVFTTGISTTVPSSPSYMTMSHWAYVAAAVAVIIGLAMLISGRQGTLLEE